MDNYRALRTFLDAYGCSFLYTATYYNGGTIYDVQTKKISEAKMAVKKKELTRKIIEAIKKDNRKKRKEEIKRAMLIRKTIETTKKAPISKKEFI